MVDTADEAWPTRRQPETAHTWADRVRSCCAVSGRR